MTFALELKHREKPIQEMDTSKKQLNNVTIHESFNKIQLSIPKIISNVVKEEFDIYYVKYNFT